MNLKLLARDDVIDENIKFPDFPELRIKYLYYKNNLCPSNYSDAKQIWEGDLSITLLVNDKIITINNHDKRQNNANNVKTSSSKYIFQGISYFILNKSREETYLNFTIIKIGTSD